MKIINVWLVPKHHVFCEDSPVKGPHDRCHSDDLDLHSRSQVHLKCDYFLTCNISDNISAITFKLGMTVDVWMPHMLMIVSLTFSLNWYKVTVGRQRENISVELFGQPSKQQALHLLQRSAIFYVTLTLQAFLWLDRLASLLSCSALCTLRKYVYYTHAPQTSPSGGSNFKFTIFGKGQNKLQVYTF